MVLIRATIRSPKELAVPAVWREKVSAARGKITRNRSTARRGVFVGQRLVAVKCRVCPVRNRHWCIGRSGALRRLRTCGFQLEFQISGLRNRARSFSWQARETGACPATEDTCEAISMELIRFRRTFGSRSALVLAARCSGCGQVDPQRV